MQAFAAKIAVGIHLIHERETWIVTFPGVSNVFQGGKTVLEGEAWCYTST